MSDDLVSFRMLVASGVGSERDLLGDCAAKAALPIDHVECVDSIDPAAIRAAVAQGNFDFIFVDSRIPGAERRAIYEAARSTKGQPLAIFIGPADLTPREVLQGGCQRGRRPCQAVRRGRSDRDDQ